MFIYGSQGWIFMNKIGLSCHKKHSASIDFHSLVTIKLPNRARKFYRPRVKKIPVQSSSQCIMHHSTPKWRGYKYKTISCRGCDERGRRSWRLTFWLCNYSYCLFFFGTANNSLKSFSTSDHVALSSVSQRINRLVALSNLSLIKENVEAHSPLFINA